MVYGNYQEKSSHSPTILNDKTQRTKQTASYANTLSISSCPKDDGNHHKYNSYISGDLCFYSKEEDSQSSQNGTDYDKYDHHINLRSDPNQEEMEVQSDLRKSFQKSQTHKRNNAKLNFQEQQDQEDEDGSNTLERASLMRNNFIQDQQMVMEEQQKAFEQIRSDIFVQAADFTQKRIICDLDDIQQIEEEESFGSGNSNTNIGAQHKQAKRQLGVINQLQPLKKTTLDLNIPKIISPQKIKFFKEYNLSAQQKSVSRPVQDISMSHLNLISRDNYAQQHAPYNNLLSRDYSNILNHNVIHQSSSVLSEGIKLVKKLVTKPPKQKKSQPFPAPFKFNQLDDNKEHEQLSYNRSTSRQHSRIIVSDAVQPKSLYNNERAPSLQKQISQGKQEHNSNFMPSPLNLNENKLQSLQTPQSRIQSYNLESDNIRQSITTKNQSHLKEQFSYSVQSRSQKGAQLNNKNSSQYSAIIYGTDNQQKHQRIKFIVNEYQDQGIVLQQKSSDTSNINTLINSNSLELNRSPFINNKTPNLTVSPVFRVNQSYTQLDNTVLNTSNLNRKLPIQEQQTLIKQSQEPQKDSKLIQLVQQQKQSFKSRNINHLQSSNTTSSVYYNMSQNIRQIQQNISQTINNQKSHLNDIIERRNSLSRVPTLSKKHSSIIGNRGVGGQPADQSFDQIDSQRSNESNLPAITTNSTKFNRNL